MTDLLDVLKAIPKGRGTSLLGLTVASALVMTPAPSMAFYPQRDTGDDAAAIQAALNASQTAGSGVVDLGNFTWDCRSKLTLDSSTTSLVGAGATVTWVNATGIDTGLLITQAIGAAYRGKNITQRIEGIHFRGKSAISRGIHLYVATNPNQETAQIAFYDCNVGGFNNNIEIADNCYICKWYHCSFDACGNACIYRLSATNNGESMSFFGCTFGNCPRALQLQGPNQDFYFYGCSFDYLSEYIVFVQSGIAEFHGCHFEGYYTNSALFQIQDDGNISIFGGAFALFGANPSGTVFQCWGSYSGRYLVVGAPMGGLTFAAGGKLCAKPECFQYVLSHGTNGSKYLAMGATVEVNAALADMFFGTLNANTTIANPTREASGRRITLVLKQAASGTGPFTLAFGNKFVFPGGAPTMPTAANGTLVVEAMYVPFEDKWYARVIS